MPINQNWYTKIKKRTWWVGVWIIITLQKFPYLVRNPRMRRVTQFRVTDRLVQVR